MSFGPISDRVGRVPVLVLGFLLSMGAIACGSQGRGDHIGPLFGALVLLGLADAANQTQITAILPVLAGDPKLVGAAFGCTIPSCNNNTSLFLPPFIPPSPPLIPPQSQGAHSLAPSVRQQCTASRAR